MDDAPSHWLRVAPLLDGVRPGELEALAFRWLDRAVRKQLADALARSGLHDSAATLRSLPALDNERSILNAREEMARMGQVVAADPHLGTSLDLLVSAIDAAWLADDAEFALEDVCISVVTAVRCAYAAEMADATAREEQLQLEEALAVGQATP